MHRMRHKSEQSSIICTCYMIDRKTEIPFAARCDVEQALCHPERLYMLPALTGAGQMRSLSGQIN